MIEKRTDTRYVDGAAAKAENIHSGPARVHWLSFFPETVNTVGVIQIYDGMDTGGRLRWQMECGVVGHFPFDPPILCEEGLYIGSDANVGGYAVNWNPEGWEA